MTSDPTTFLTGTRWQDWQTDALAGDASSRTYARLTAPDGETAILMDARAEAPMGMTQFVNIARWLTAHGLSAPRILRQGEGLLLLEDLGPQTLAVAATHETEDALYDAAVNVLIALDRLAPPDGLGAMTPDVGAQMVAIAAEVYHPCDPAPLTAAVGAALTAHAPRADRLALRDYHAENLIWRPARRGLDHIGLLDFQDAFVAPRGYDLASLLRDIRRPVTAAQVTRQTARFADATGADPAALGAQLAVLGAQRNLRILGVFARLAQRGKPSYAALLPAVWDALLRDLAHPALHDLARVVLATLPPPHARA
ncbi:hypothetical protein SAMN04488003_109108 [Loktanella fryxellensis]|uniref:Aminoglycoside phosphotransferase domain-containing protein n=1 Tax=Loktanella fryxellensis TaxID=245187 RepID=A0A1H8DYG4_9RHOB|nr:phosphotransferase [Loktanella fryxellensis]SEN12361.1 hypothetical protein SAMN04488003_109108 [Loktanella fryxellensis]